jgi:hypothetical protein
MLQTANAHVLKVQKVASACRNATQELPSLHSLGMLKSKPTEIERSREPVTRMISVRMIWCSLNWPSITAFAINLDAKRSRTDAGGAYTALGESWNICRSFNNWPRGTCGSRERVNGCWRIGQSLAHSAGGLEIPVGAETLDPPGP